MKPAIPAERPGGSVTERVPVWALAGGVIALIAVVLATIAIVGDDTLPERAGPPIEEIAVESTRLEPNQIELTLRNTGPDAVEVAQVFVADAYANFTGAEEPDRQAQLGDHHGGIPLARGPAVPRLARHLDRRGDRA